MVALFVDLKAVFDSDRRGFLMEAIRERGIREGLTKRVGRLLRVGVGETRSKERDGRKFLNGKGNEAGLLTKSIAFQHTTGGLSGEMGRVR